MAFFSSTQDKKKRNSSSFFTRPNAYDTESVNRSISNAQTRIRDAGYQPEDTDQRNWFERATNLPEKQNAFFDSLELLGRGGQAILNPISKAIKGEEQNVASSFFKGLSGREKVRGSEVAEDLGVENKFGKFALGTAIDIGTDPISYVPGGVLLKGAKGAGKIASMPAKAGYNALEKVSPKLKQAREEVIQPNWERTKDGLGYMFKDDYKATETLTGGKSPALTDAFRKAENQRRYLKEQATKNITDTAKITGLEAGDQVGRVMEKNLKQFEELPLSKSQLKQSKEIDDELSDLLPKARQTNQEIRDLKKFHLEDTKLGASVPLLNQIREVTGGKLIKTSDMEEIKQLPSWIKRKDGMAIDEIADELGYKYSDDLVQDLKSGLAKKPKSKDIRPMATERLLNDDYYKGLQETKEGYGQAISSMRSAKQSIQPEVKEIARKAREMPKDPKVTQAAESLMKSNDQIRELARVNEIPISELEGYMTHVLAKAEREARKKAKASNFLGTNQPNKSILKQRELMGSAEDVNERLRKSGRIQDDQNFFEPNAYYATAIGQRRLIDYIQSVGFRKEVLNNPDFARPYVKGMDLPPNGVVIDSNNYKFIKESGDMLEGVASKDIGGQYVVTKAVKQKLDKYKNAMTDEGSKAFLNAFDSVQSFWKRAALFSVPYHLRNDIGAKFNNWVGGMSAADLVKYSGQADKEVYDAIIKGNPSKMYDEYLQQGLGATSQSQIEFARRGADPEMAIEKMVKEGSKDMKGKAKDRLNPLRAFETSREFGDFIDQTNRFAAYKWAREKLKLPPEQAAQKAFETQFDYTRTSNFERDFMVRAVPFYRWMRNNLPFQIRQFANDPRKYVNLNKGRLNAQEVAGINEENIPDWMKEGLYFPVSSDGKGSGQMLGFNLPAGDLGRLNEPLKMGVDSLTPLLKLPLELGLNRNFFYDKPIKKFEGQEKKFQIPGTNVSFGLPVKAAYALEQSTGQLGRGLSKTLTPDEKEDQDTKFRLPTLGISGVLKDFDADKANYFEAWEDLKDLQDLMNYIEQQTGERPRLMADIKKDQKKSSFFAK